eukprot:5197685-Alexandrium_andersonii.AAC.1
MHRFKGFGKRTTSFGTANVFLHERVARYWLECRDAFATRAPRLGITLDATRAGGLDTLMLAC